MKDLVVAIDACRCRSGGAVAHILGIINTIGQYKTSYQLTVHIWGYNELLNEIKEAPYIFKHESRTYGLGKIGSLVWQRYVLHKEIRKLRCDILFSADAASLCQFKPYVSLSQDALSFEPGTIRRFLFSPNILRMLTIFYIQKYNLRNSDGNIFLTNYARTIVENHLDFKPRSQIVSHGVNEYFLKPTIVWKLQSNVRELKCIYVSNYSLYKNQWNVVKSINFIDKRPIELTLVGGGEGRPLKLTQKAISKVRLPSKVVDLGRIEHSKLPSEIVKHELFIFASTCETISITLLEAMALGMPIVCSNAGPMPEVLGKDGIYFDADEPESIARAICDYMDMSDDEKISYSLYVRERVKHLSWSKCSESTFSFIQSVHSTVTS